MAQMVSNSERTGLLNRVLWVRVPSGSPALAVSAKTAEYGCAGATVVLQRSVKRFPQGKHCQFESGRTHKISSLKFLKNEINGSVRVIGDPNGL